MSRIREVLKFFLKEGPRLYDVAKRRTYGEGGREFDKKLAEYKELNDQDEL